MSVKTKVLIIGAGPTGLMAACQLKRFGIQHIIIDKKDGPSDESRAMIVQARSLEIFDHMGLANEALLQGALVEKFQVIIRNKKVQEIKLGKIGEGLSPFPFVLSLEQSKNEQLLLKDLTGNGGTVGWNTELISLIQEDDRVVAVLRDNNGLHEVTSEFLIAADGASSSVRKYLELPFIGDTYQHKFYLADTRITTRWHDLITLHLSPRSFVGIFPLQGSDKYRIIGIIPHEIENEEEVSLPKLVPYIEKQIQGKLDISDTTWFSVYHLHHRRMEHFRYQRIFFAGDAAHIHSPVGGQGMNTGLQDAYNLCWKLAMVVSGHAAESLLDTYEQERLPVARKLLQSTDRAFNVVNSSKLYWRLSKIYLLPSLVSILFRLKKFRLKLFRGLSQTGIRYVDSDLTVMRMVEPIGIKAGERFPYLKTAEGQSVYQMMNGQHFHAVVFFFEEGKNSHREMADLVKEKAPWVQVVDLSEEEEIKKSLKITKDTIILVRPDHYIGLITDESVKVARDYMHRLAIEKKDDELIKLPKIHS